jgi:hypothetical protein
MTLEQLPDRVQPSATHFYAVGSDIGGTPSVDVYNESGSLARTLFPFDSGYTGGVRVATGDLTGDGVDDIAVAPGPGIAPEVKVYDGATGTIVRDFLAYEPAFLGGVNVALGDVTGDGKADVVTGVGVGGGPRVEVFDGATGTEVANFFAYEPSFLGGVNVAAGDVNGDGKADIVTGVGVGGGPRVEVFDGVTGATLYNFFAYESTFRGGVNVAAGDVNGDGKADIVSGTGFGGGPRVVVFDGATGNAITNFFAFDPAFRGGVAVATTDLDADGKAEILAAPGPGMAPLVKLFNGTTGAEVREFYAFNPNLLCGVTTGDGAAPADSYGSGDAFNNCFPPYVPVDPTILPGYVPPDPGYVYDDSGDNAIPDNSGYYDSGDCYCDPGDSGDYYYDPGDSGSYDSGESGSYDSGNSDYDSGGSGDYYYDSGDSGGWDF